MEQTKRPSPSIAVLCSLIDRMQNSINSHLANIRVHQNAIDRAQKERDRVLENMKEILSIGEASDLTDLDKQWLIEAREHLPADLIAQLKEIFEDFE